MRCRRRSAKRCSKEQVEMVVQVARCVEVKIITWAGKFRIGTWKHDK